MHAAKSFDVLERWVFDVEAFPAWGDAGMEEEQEEQAFLAAGVEMEEDDESVNWTDVNEALRGALRRVAHAAEMMPPLPAGSTFTLAVELRDEAAAPIGVSIFYSLNRLTTNRDYSTHRIGSLLSLIFNHQPRRHLTRALRSGAKTQHQYVQYKPAPYSLNAG